MRRFTDGEEIQDTSEKLLQPDPGTALQESKRIVQESGPRIVYYSRKCMRVERIMTDQQYPEPTVGALIINHEGNIFLMKSHKWNGQYCIPGGHVELGETIEAAVIREVKEETGLDVYDLEFLCFQEFVYGESFWKKRHFIFFDYSCKADTSEVTLNDEAEEYVWISLDKGNNLPIESYTRNVIKEYVKKHREI